MTMLKLSKFYFILVLFPVALFAGKVHEAVQKIKDEKGVCKVLDIKVLDSKRHNKSMCLLNTFCENDVRWLRRVVPCEAQSNGTECPSLDACLENAVVYKRDTTRSDAGIFESKTQESIKTNNGEICTLKDKAPNIYKVEGESSANQKLWDGFCMLNTECKIQNTTLPRYLTVCKPKDQENNENMIVCPTFRDCYDNQIVPRDPKVGEQLTRHRATQASGHR